MAVWCRCKGAEIARDLCGEASAASWRSARLVDLVDRQVGLSKLRISFPTDVAFGHPDLTAHCAVAHPQHAAMLVERCSLGQSKRT